MYKQTWIYLVAVLFLVGSTACDDDEHIPEPVAPILKDIQYPSENDIMPGQITQINGLGFSKEDKLYLKNEISTQEAEVREVTDSYLRFLVPIEAGGEYAVLIERSGKQTTLPGTLHIPLVVPITDIELPAGNIQQLGEVYIAGKGFANGDMVKLYASFYPEQKEYDIPATLASDGIKFTLPQGVYGVNSIVIVRGDRRTNLGTITIETNVGDRIGGGVVFWVDATKAHGYIVNMTSIGTPTEPFGPEVAPENAFGTSEAMGSGYENTQNSVTKMAQLRRDYGWPEWTDTKIAAELCAEHSITENELTYTDWFLPSREELIQLFYVKSLLEEKGVNIPPNNYWTSSEANGEQGWAAYYVNFYEDTNLISEFVSKSSWLIGVLPIRSY
ncbi:MAG: DUF1566 domain-containing protein [Tannerellaceae bacterium]|nr:DUF1566 domain-containing protein [Tannerellaceae bacterium]